MAMKSRKAPSLKTLRNLYLLSGNQCANPDCATVLINANGTLVAEVCHIKAVNRGAARYDKDMNSEQLRQSENLLLLCSTCHTLVDAEPKTYSVSRLRKWKKDREQRFAAVGDTLRQRYVQEVTDEADSLDFGAPRSLSAYTKFLEATVGTHTVDDDTPDTVREYVRRLRHLSLEDRELVRGVIEKALAIGGSRERESGIYIHPDDLKTLTIGIRRFSDYRIRKLGDTLDRNLLGGLDYDDIELCVMAADVDLPWSLVKEFLEERGHNLRDVVCELKFSLLD